MNLDRVKFHCCLTCGWRGRRYALLLQTKLCPECHQPVWEETTGITRATDDAGADENMLEIGPDGDGVPPYGHAPDCPGGCEGKGYVLSPVGTRFECRETADGPSAEASPGHVICPVCKGDGTGAPIGADGCGRCGGEGEVPLSQAKGAPSDDVETPEPDPLAGLTMTGRYIVNDLFRQSADLAAAHERLDIYAVPPGPITARLEFMFEQESETIDQLIKAKGLDDTGRTSQGRERPAPPGTSGPSATANAYHALNALAQTIDGTIWKDLTVGQRTILRPFMRKAWRALEASDADGVAE